MGFFVIINSKAIFDICPLTNYNKREKDYYLLGKGNV